MSEQPGHPVPEGGRPSDDRPAERPPARDGQAGEVGTPGRPELPTQSERQEPEPQERPDEPKRDPSQKPGPSGPRLGAPSGWRALWLGGIALLTAFFFYPLGLVLGIAAIVTGVRARRAAQRGDGPKHRHGKGAAQGAVPGIVLGSVGLALSTFSVALSVFLWTELSGYQECIGAANTGIDRETCQTEWFPKIEDKMGLPEGSMDQYGDLL